jgi:hypothetical protein
MDGGESRAGKRLVSPFGTRTRSGWGLTSLFAGSCQTGVPSGEESYMHYIFAGRTRTEGVGVTFDVKNPPLKLTVAGIEGQECQVSLLLSGAMHFAVAVTTAVAMKDIATFRNQIMTVCKSLYDVASFLNAVSVHVELTSLSEIETDRFWTFRDAAPELMASAHERPLPTEEFIKLSLLNNYLRSALSDLNEAMSSPNDTGFFCYRAIETLLQEFKEPDKMENKDAWPRFRDALQVTQNWIKPLTDHSKSNRHGELQAVSGEQRVFLMKNAWTIVYRFACLKLRKEATLPASEFPLLDTRI